MGFAPPTDPSAGWASPLPRAHPSDDESRARICSAYKSPGGNAALRSRQT